MIKRLHLVCNAHIDPVWQWEWEEGAAETLSTFGIAADFCEQYDSFVFCHNEALLYRWVEELNPELFSRIQRLVKEGKWHIMGGWHLQPDCNMPSGEMFVRQIASGRSYFKEKFGVEPTVAVNVDPFGHSRGLVQIMKKCGYEGYMFMRPSPEFLDLPENSFRWKGYDGSEVIATRISYGYNSGKGQAADKVSRILRECPDEDFYLCFWGIGNHGGGPSKKDLDDLTKLIEDEKKNGNGIIHSTPEKYLEELKKVSLPTVEKSLNPWAPGCYTSQIRVKQQYRRAENEYILTESICSHASSVGLIDYPEKELFEALYDILTVQFHDMLPGSSIQPAEEMALRMLSHALEILSRIRFKAFTALLGGQKKADPDKIPVFLYNPYPYEISGDFTAEFMLWDQVRDFVFMSPKVYDESGALLNSQCEKEYSSVPCEWRKRVVFNTTLKPMAISRFDCAFERLPEKPKYELPRENGKIVHNKNGLRVAVDERTGLVSCLEKDGVRYLDENSFKLEVFKDNFDPWSMINVGWYEKKGEFTALTPEEVRDYYCVSEPVPAVRVVESGDVRTVIEAAFGYKKSNAVIKYIISHGGEFSVDIRINWSEKQELVKLSLSPAFDVDSLIGETAYGREELKRNCDENVSQKYIITSGEGRGFVTANNGTYGSSFDGENNALKLTLMRSASYCAHPIDDRIVLPQDRMSDYMEQGERDFSFGFSFGEKENMLNTAARFARHFNIKPFAVSVYPTGGGEKCASPLELTNSDIIEITAFKKSEDGNAYTARLFNPTNAPQVATLRFKTATASVTFTPYEIKTLALKDEGISETDLLQ